MIRVVRMSNKYYGIQVDITTDEEQENIDVFVNEGTPVILVNELSDLETFDIDPDDVEMLEK